MERDNLQKIMVTGRIPLYMKEYFEKNNISIAKAIEFAFEKYRENDYDFCMNKLHFYEEKVLHYRQKVLHMDNESNTKTLECNTIRDTFQSLGRGSPENKKQDMNWLKPKVVVLQKKGIAISSEELYQYCTKQIK